MLTSGGRRPKRAPSRREPPRAAKLQYASAGLDDTPHLGRGISLVDSRSGYEDLRPRLYHERRGLGCYAAVHLYGEVDHLFQPTDLLHHLGDKRLSAETRIYAHDEH